MIIKKAMVACFIFVILFAGAWLMEEKQRRMNQLVTRQLEYNGAIPISYPLNLPNKESHKPFGPREYIRIKPIM